MHLNSFVATLFLMTALRRDGVHVWVCVSVALVLALFLEQAVVLQLAGLAGLGFLLRLGLGSRLQTKVLWFEDGLVFAVGLL